ncbi:MAG: hypothetical protein EB027_07940, partial [Actinobacteria bacterium]|nr:hypothetical protein [Actinomycetota bacterium]
MIDAIRAVRAATVAGRAFAGAATDTTDPAYIARLEELRSHYRSAVRAAQRLTPGFVASDESTWGIDPNLAKSARAGWRKLVKEGQGSPQTPDASAGRDRVAHEARDTSGRWTSGASGSRAIPAAPATRMQGMQGMWVPSTPQSRAATEAFIAQLEAERARNQVRRASRVTGPDPVLPVRPSALPVRMPAAGASAVGASAVGVPPARVPIQPSGVAGLPVPGTQATAFPTGPARWSRDAS